MNYKKKQFVTHFNSTIYHRAGGIEAFTPVTPPDFFRSVTPIPIRGRLCPPHYHLNQLNKKTYSNRLKKIIKMKFGFHCHIRWTTYTDAGGEGAGGAFGSPVFGRSVTPIPTRGSRLCPTHYVCPPLPTSSYGLVELIIPSLPSSILVLNVT